MTVDEYFLLEPTKNSFQFKKRWWTSIQTGLDGTEQRSSLITWPRRSITAKYFAKTYDELNYLKRILFKSLHLTWGIPFWQDKTTLISQASSGLKILNVGSTLYRNFEVGSLCILFQSITSFEVGEIDSFTETQITLVTNLSSTWPVGTKVYPLLKSRIEPQQEIDLLDPARGGIAITSYEEFDEDIERHVPNIDDFDVYLGLPIFHFKPRHNQLKQILYHPYSHLSFLGKSYKFTHYDETILPLEGEYVIIGREMVNQCLDFFDYHKGRWGEFWLPTHQRDIVISEPFDSDDVTFTVEPIEYPTYWSGKKASHYVVFQWPDDTLICREIVGASGNTITIDSALGIASNSPNKIIVSFLLLGRFDMDEIEMKMNYSLIEMGFTTLRFLSLLQEPMPIEEEST